MTTRQTPLDGSAWGRKAEPARYQGAGLARYGPALGMIWIVFLAEPFRASLAAPTVALRVTGVVGVAGTAALFVRALYRFRSRRPPTRGEMALLVAAQLVCIGLTTLAAAQHGLVGLVFVCVSMVLIMPRRAGIVTVVALLLGLLLLPRVVPGWQPEDGTVVSAVLASLAVLGLRGVVERNRKLVLAHEEVAALAVSRERERIARDMHDILGHSLTVVSVKAELAARLLRAGAGQDGAPALTPNAERAADELAEIQALARSALADMRGMVAGERQVTLAGELAAARSAFDAAGIDADLPGAVDEVAEGRRDVFAWALREGTTNVLRHAAARHVVVTLTPDALVMDDDGRGRRGDEAAASNGHGLTGLTERAGAAGLAVATGPSPLGGLRLEVRAPDGPAQDRKDTA
ncbi:sensor histidine kinase [Promicromonospora sp. NPDC090134]|uniref:sensor histidine kinase n=1 Tax=Promicromonospora sp. NPDC090134 TaxID=3364408 RepID=UPI0038046EFF